MSTLLKTCLFGAVCSLTSAQAMDLAHIAQEIKAFESELKEHGLRPRQFANRRLQSSGSALDLLPSAALREKLIALERDLKFLYLTACPARGEKPASVSKDFLGVSVGVNIIAFQKAPSAEQKAKAVELYGHFYCATGGTSVARAVTAPATPVMATESLSSASSKKSAKGQQVQGSHTSPSVSSTRGNAPTTSVSAAPVTYAPASSFVSPKMEYPQRALSSLLSLPWVSTLTVEAAARFVSKTYGPAMAHEARELAHACTQYGVSAPELFTRIYTEIYRAPPPGPDLRRVLSQAPEGMRPQLEQFLKKL